MQYIYLIQSGEYLKIGIANDPKSRLAQLQTGNPTKLQLVSCYGFEDSSAIEKVLHQKYASNRVNGEWFYFEHNPEYEFNQICSILGGNPLDISKEAQPEDVKQADKYLASGKTWVELVKVKKWYSLRLMGWDANKNKKVYIKYIGTLNKCKSDPLYSEEAKRLENELNGKDVTTY